jgi:catechol 2,3-dioxygenase-like lactoylglutathione lyase family enzyme
VRLHHLALRVADCERSQAFYTGILGLRELRRNEHEGELRSVWLSAGDVVLMIERGLRGRPGAAGSGHVLAFSVADLDDWEGRLRGAGIAVEDRTPSTIYVSDPDGHRVGLSVYRF